MLATEPAPLKPVQAFDDTEPGAVAETEPNQ
jgi:hypothetical protein